MMHLLPAPIFPVGIEIKTPKKRRKIRLGAKQCLQLKNCTHQQSKKYNRLFSITGNDLCDRGFRLREKFPGHRNLFDLAKTGLSKRLARYQAKMVRC